MKKSEFLKASAQNLQHWLVEMRGQISKAPPPLSPKLRDYLDRQLNEETLANLESFLKKRATVIMYLQDATDFTENQGYGAEEVHFAMGLLTPEDFDPEKDCIYCLSSFQGPIELQNHFRDCAI